MALDFNGTSQYVEVGDVAALSFERTDPITFMVWINGDTLTGFQTIINKGDLEAQIGYLFTMDGGKPSLRLVNSVITNWLISTSDGIVSVGEWTHIAVTYDGSSTAAGVTFYINGLATTATISEDNLSDTILNFVPVQIASRDSGAFEQFNGRMEDFQIYKRKLLASEVQTVYASRGVNQTTLALAARYPFDEGPPPIAATVAGTNKDVTENRNDGTPSNSPLFADGVLRFRRKVA